MMFSKQDIDSDKVSTIDLVDIKASATSLANKKLFYVTEIEIKMRMIISQNIKEFAFFSSHLVLLKSSYSVF